MAEQLCTFRNWFEFGFCFFWTVFLLFAHYGPFLGVQVDQYGDSLIWERFALPLVTLFIAVAIRVKGGPIGLKRGPHIAGIIQCAAVILQVLAVFETANAPLLLTLSAVLFGISTALFLLLWQMYYGSIKPSRAGVLIPSSILLSIPLAYLLALLPAWMLLVACAVVCPLLASYSLAKSLKIVQLNQRTQEEPSIKEVASLLWRPAICLMILAFLWQVATWLFDQRSVGGLAVLYTIDNIGLFVALLVLVFVSLSVKSHLDVVKIYSSLLPIIIALFVLLPFSVGVYGGFLAGILYFGFELASLSLAYLSASISYKNHWSPQMVYGLAMLPEFIALGVGYTTGKALPVSEGPNAVLAVVALSLGSVYLLFMVYYLMNNSYKMKTDKNDSIDIDSFLDSITSEHRLTSREKEILGLIVRGYSLPLISEKLFISLNTTKGHVKSIYKELNVHSKQELIEAAHQHVSKT